MSAKSADGAVTAVQIAPGAITPSQLAPGVLREAQIDPAQVQARVVATCLPGRYLRGINPDGSVVCAPVVALHASTTVDDSADPVGETTPRLVDRSAAASGLALPPGHPFIITSDNRYWSGTSRDEDLTRAWVMVLASGTVGLADKTIFSAPWCVRGGLNTHQQ